MCPLSLYVGWPLYTILNPQKNLGMVRTFPLRFPDIIDSPDSLNPSDLSKSPKSPDTPDLPDLLDQ